MSDFRSEQLKELISMVCKAAKLDKCRFTFYLHSEIKPTGWKENQNVEEVPMLLEKLKRDYGLACEIKDTNKMSSKEVKDAYRVSVYWVRSLNRPYGISRRIYDIFVGGEPGERFGKEIPAMIAYDFSGNVLFMLPHVVEGFSDFSLRAYVLKRNQSFREDAILTIYDFLKALKDDLEKKR